ncbi:protein kinase C-binding protein 1 [Trichonephila clavipes]|nr:protein kinase C-binding protein 1 [Trichonephila clavipes]
MVQKKRSYSHERQNPKKRSADPSPGTIEAKKACIVRRPDDKREHDKYCWICHELGQDINCYLCTRAYHDECLIRTSGEFTPLQVCPECQLKSLDGIEPHKFINVDKLKVILRCVVIKVFQPKHNKKEMFLRWPEDLGINELDKIIDFGVLLDNLNKKVHYTKIPEFYSDTKYFFHNCAIMFGANSEEARAAEQLRKLFKKELLDLEACHDCYYRLYCDEPGDLHPFVRLCNPSHDIVWAQLTGHPFWPAKCIKVAKGIAHVRYFGEHEVSDLPLNKLFHISKSHPKFKDSDIFSESKSGPKSHHFKAAVKELREYIELYTSIHGEFQFYPHRTRYASKSQPDSDEVSKIRFLLHA